MDQNLENNLEFKNKLINFYNNNRTKVFIILSILIISIITLFFSKYNYEKKNQLISEKYVQAGIFISLKKDNEAKKLYEEIILSKNKFYSILSFNTILEKNLETDKNKILNYFEMLEKISYTEDKLDLIKMKKALYLIKINEDELGFNLLDKLIKKNSDLKNIAEEIIVE